MEASIPTLLQVVAAVDMLTMTTNLMPIIMEILPGTKNQVQNK
jgi:hypothetical protein